MSTLYTDNSDLAQELDDSSHKVSSAIKARDRSGRVLPIGFQTEFTGQEGPAGQICQAADASGSGW